MRLVATEPDEAEWVTDALLMYFGCQRVLFFLHEEWRGHERLTLSYTELLTLRSSTFLAHGLLLE